MLMPKRFAVSAGLRWLSMVSFCGSSPRDGSNAFSAYQAISIASVSA
jgi:hypothetical protein